MPKEGRSRELLTNVPKNRYVWFFSLAILGVAIDLISKEIGSFLQGVNTTIFAYGQTGAGKTYTMMGTSDGSVSGMYTLAAYDILKLLGAYEGLELFVSFYEIYCGQLYDLLNKRARVQCMEDKKMN